MTAPLTPAPSTSAEELDAELTALAHAELDKADIDITSADEALAVDEHEAASAHSLAAIARLLSLITRLVVEDGLP